MKRFDPDQPGRRQINAWLGRSQPGGVLELPLSEDDPVDVALTYQYNTLLHGHPIVNGYSGYESALQKLLGGSGSPLKGTDAEIISTLAGLRSIGVRFVVFSEVVNARTRHLWSQDAGRIAWTLSQASDHVVSARHEDGIWAWQLAGAPPLAPLTYANLFPVTRDAFTASASSEPADIRFAFDGNLATRWSTRSGQAGNEWIRIAFDRERDIGCLELDMGRDYTGEYPRELAIDTETADGARQVAFAGSVVTTLIEGIARDGRSSRVRVELPPGRARALWIRQTGRADGIRWTIAELKIWQRRS